MDGKNVTWGMARLAMVRPETTSDLRSLRLYVGPHSSTGNMYCAPRISFFLDDCFFKWRRGSSEKNVSFRRVFSFRKVLRWGGSATRCTSVSMGISTVWGVVNSDSMWYWMVGVCGVFKYWWSSRWRPTVNRLSNRILLY